MLEIQPHVLADIVRRMEQTVGLAPNVAQFHAYDEHQQPLPDQLTATQYAEWLLKTNAQRSPEELKTFAQRYRDAFASQRTAIGITPGQLAHLYIAGEVLGLLVPSSQFTPAAMPIPIVKKIQPQPIQPLQPVVAKPQTAAHQATESQKDLEMLRSQLMSELGIQDGGVALNAKDLEQAVQNHIAAKTKELNTLVNQGILTENERDAKLQQARREQERRAIELRSIEARVHLESSEGAVTPIVTDDHARAVDTLRKQEKEVLAGMDAMEKILDTAGLPPEELKHIRHQLNAVEELMEDIEEETS